MRNDFCLFKRTTSTGKPVWYYTAWRGNKRVYRSTGMRTRGEALHYCMERVREGSLVGPKRVSGDIPFSQFAEGFFDDGSPYMVWAEEHARAVTKGTMMNVKRALKIFAEYMGDTPLCNIRQRDLDGYARYLLSTGRSGATAKILLNSLERVFRYAKYEEIIKENPFDGYLRVFPNEEKPRDAFTADEVRKLFSERNRGAWRNEISRLACMLAAQTGMRLGEVCGLSVEDISEEWITVRHSLSPTDGMKSTKSGKERIVPMPTGLYQQLMRVSLNGRVISVDRQTVNNHLRLAEGKLGVRQLSFHSFRHFFVSQLGGSQVPEAVKRAVVGHASEAMTDRYTHILSADVSLLRDAQDKILS